MSATETRKRVFFCLPFVAVIAVLAFHSVLTWQRWGDPLIDKGRELNVPARIAGGEELYRDVRYYYGPLAPYLNALLYRVFGLHSAVPAWGALAACVAGLGALFRITKRLLSPNQTALALSFVVSLSFFLPSGGCMAFPYSFDALYASVLGWWALYFAIRGLHGDLLRAGLLIAVAFCAKIEAAGVFFLAIAVAILLEDSARFRKLVQFSAAAFCLPAVVYGAFATRLPIATLVNEGFLAFLHVPESWRHLYSYVAGFDFPATHMMEILVVGILVAALLSCLAALSLAIASSRFFQGDRRRSVAAFAAIGALLGGIGLLYNFPTPAVGRLRQGLPQTVSLLPPMVLLWAVILLVRRFHENHVSHLDAGGVPAALVLAGALTSWRVFLRAGNAGPYNSFALVLPLLLVSILIIRVFPSAMERLRAGAGENARQMAVVLIAVWSLTRLEWSVWVFRDPSRWSAIETGRGRLWISPPRYAEAISQAIEVLRSETVPGDSIAGFPEGGAFNFFTGRRSPIAQEQFLIGTLDPGTEAAIIERLKQTPPAWIVVHVVTYPFGGQRLFGEAWGPNVGKFLRERYEPKRILTATRSPAAPGDLEGAIVLLKKR